MHRDNFRCRDCGRDEDTLNVHHEIYVYGKKPWEYESDQLTTLCANCHTKRHTKNLQPDEHLKSIGDILSTFQPGSYLDKQRKELLNVYNPATEVLNDENLKMVWIRFMKDISAENKAREVNTYFSCKKEILNNENLTITVSENISYALVSQDENLIRSYLRTYFPLLLTVKINANEEIKKTA